MDKETTVAPDEAKAEQEALAEAKEDEIRSKIVSELGLSEDDNKELIDSLVKREIGHRSKLSEAIGQKRKWREAAQKPKPEERNDVNPPTFDPEQIRKETESTIKSQLEQRDLDEMEHSDEIKAEIKKLAALQNISVRKAEKDPYIQHLIKESEDADRTDEAATNHAPRSRPGKSDKAPKFDFSTKEGREEYAKWKADKANKE